MRAIGELVRDLQPHSLLSLCDQLVYLQIHHHGVFLDQTISDALGGEGWAVRKQAAFESAHALLEAVFKAKNVEGAAERLESAAELFASMGHGKLVFDITAEGGMVRGDGLHYGTSFAEKYGKLVRHKHPVDSFGAGFAAAAASLAFPSDWGHFEAEEVACVAKGDSGCAFSLSRRPERPRLGVTVTRQVVSSLPLKAPPLDAPSSQYPQAIPSAMRVTRNLSADEHTGGLRAFGGRLAVVPVGYVNQITYDTMHLLENRTPELVPVYAALVREAAQAGAFYLLGGILASPEWAISSKATGDVEHRLEKLLAIARVLGWGRWYSIEFFPGQSLVVRSPATMESIYYATRYGASVRNRLFFQQGAVLAVMQLLHRVDFAAEAPISPVSYASLFKNGPRFHVEETRSPLRGDDMCEIVVEALSER